MRPTLVPALLLAAAAVAATGCATNPATGKKQLSLISKNQEVAMGRQAAQEVAQTMPMYQDARVQEYVAGVAKRLAAGSESPELPWTFAVVDDASVNAFALPGGYIFFTRGILTHMNSEAELAAVAGHEIGHVTARHGVQMMQKAQLAQLGLGVASVLSESIARYGQLAGVGMQLLFLKYGRDAEKQADDLGFRYMLKQRYDPREMKDMFATLGGVSKAAGAEGKLPEWLSSHPNPENRFEATEERIKKLGALPPGLTEGREPFLAMLDGMVFGEDPRQGFFQGVRFLHPGMKFQMDFPQGWQTQNTPAAVVAGSPQQDALLGLASVPQGVTPEAALRQFLSQQGIRAGQANPAAGLPPHSAVFQAQTEQGVVEGVTSFFTHGGATLQLLGYTAGGGLQKYQGDFVNTFRSFRELTDPAALAVQPAKVKLVKLTQDMTLEQFLQAYPSSAKPEQVALINGLYEGKGTLKAGTTVKQIVGGVKPQ